MLQNQTDSLALHSYRRCPFAIRVRMVLEEKEIPYRLIEENLASLSPELLALHPEGKVPLLIHARATEGLSSQTVLYQSSIITEYLEEAFPRAPVLMPQSPEARASVRLWTYWCDQIFKPDLDFYKYEWTSLGEDAKTELKNRLHQHLEKWNSALQGRPYLMGSEPTLADIHLFPFARQFVRAKPEFIPIDQSGPYSLFSEWLERMIARPAFKRVMQK